MQSILFFPFAGVPVWNPAGECSLLVIKDLSTAERVSVESDVQAVFSFFTLDDLRRLASAFRNGLVVTGRYTAGGGRGCLLYHLDHSITDAGSHAARFSSDPEAYAASQRVVAAWDSGGLAAEAVRSLIEHAIAEREKRNEAEEQTIHRVRSALAALPPQRRRASRQRRRSLSAASAAPRGRRASALRPVPQPILKGPSL